MDAVALLNDVIHELATNEKLANDAFNGRPDGNPITLGPRVIDAATMAEKMIQGAKNRASAWLKNSLSPSINPKEAALAAKDKYKNNMQKALNEGRFEKGVAAQDLDLRAASITACGETGFSSGIDRKAEKIRARIAKLQPLLMAVAVANDRLPVATEADRENKIVTNLRMMRALKGKAKGTG